MANIEFIPKKKRFLKKVRLKYISIRSKKTKRLDLCFHKVDRYSFINKIK